MLGKAERRIPVEQRNATGKPKIMKIPGRSTRNGIKGRPEALNGKYRLFYWETTRGKTKLSQQSDS